MPMKFDCCTCPGNKTKANICQNKIHLHEELDPMRCYKKLSNTKSSLNEAKTILPFIVCSSGYRLLPKMTIRPNKCSDTSPTVFSLLPTSGIYSI